MVITARNNRPLIAVSGAVTTYTTFDVSILAAYEQLHGELKKNRIVHLQYLAIDQAQAINLQWGTEPVFSKDVDATMTTARAGLTNPIAIDRWSYDPAMRLAFKQAGTQNYYFEIMEYEVTPYEGEPPAPYLHLMANGQAILVESPRTATAISSMQGRRRRQRGEQGGAD